MITSAKFEKWHADSGRDDYIHDLIVWESALSSLEVTPELAGLASDVYSDALEVGHHQTAAMSFALNAVFAAIKEGKA